MICNKCNHNLPDDSEFCQYCGSKIEKTTSKQKANSDEVLETVIKTQAEETIKNLNENSKNQPNYESDADFGLVPEKPIYTLAIKSVTGEKEFLSQLYADDGSKIKWERRGSMSVDGVNGIVDIYDAYLPSGTLYKTIYMNMYGARKSAKAPAGFIQNSTGVKPKQYKQKGKKKFTIDIFNLLLLILPIFSSIIALDFCSSYTEGMFGTIIGFGLIAMLFKFLKIKKFKKNTIITIILLISLLIMIIPCLTEDLWDEDEGIAAIIFFSTLYLFGYEIYKLFINKYYGTQSYKLKCYKKINTINEYREKGIITQAEYEETRKQIISKISN